MGRSDKRFEQRSLESGNLSRTGGGNDAQLDDDRDRAVRGLGEELGRHDVSGGRSANEAGRGEGGDERRPVVTPERSGAALPGHT